MTTTIQNCNIQQGINKEQSEAIVALAEAAKQNAVAIQIIANSLKPATNQYGIYLKTEKQEPNYA
jgi:hypothetical protein